MFVFQCEYRMTLKGHLLGNIDGSPTLLITNADDVNEAKRKFRKALKHMCENSEADFEYEILYTRQRKDFLWVK